MRKQLMPGLILAILYACMGIAPRSDAAEIEWTLKKQLKLDAAPMEVAPSADGKWLYVLTSGEILVYSVSEDRVVSRIPVDKTFDRLTFSGQNNTLIASSSGEKTLKIIQLDFVQHFSLEGLPFTGPSSAPVTLVVFSDYQ